MIQLNSFSGIERYSTLYFTTIQVGNLHVGILVTISDGIVVGQNKVHMPIARIATDDYVMRSWRAITQPITCVRYRVVAHKTRRSIVPRFLSDLVGDAIPR